jgi:tetratricopeptide (TPR) repeat protein
MGKIIDLTSQPDHDILHSTQSDGLLGGSYLHGEPLVSVLREHETPRYALRNKKSGLTVEGESERTLTPDSDYQVFALVTDLRIEFVAGKSGGDESLTLPLSDVVEAGVDSGFRTSRLEVETLDGERWVFPCRGDPSPVAAYIEETAQLRANAARLLDDLEAVLGNAQDSVTAGEYSRADADLDEAAEILDAALGRISELGDGAAAEFEERVDELREWLGDVRRELAAGKGARAHALGQNHWSREEYEAAATAYEKALASYEAALGTDGSVPADGAIESRYRAAVAEREILRVGPLVDADTSRRQALALTDPEDAAAEWETALERYRELLGLDWGAAEREFAVDRDVIREQTTEIADDAIRDHREAGRRWLRAGDKLAVQDRTRQARQVYERARHQFEQARRLASEVRPERTAEAEEALEAADSRLAGATPTSEVPADPVAFDPDAEESEEEEQAEDGTEGLSELSFADTGISAGTTEDSEPSDAERPDPEGSGDGSSPSVLERIQAQKAAGGSGPFDEESVETAESPVEEDRSETGEAGETSDDEGPVLDEEGIDDALDALEGYTLASFVAALWEAEGWMTTAFEGSGETVYDVVAVREEPDERLLIWTRAAGKADRTTVKQCATAVDSDDTKAALVTTGTLSSTAKGRAETLGVAVVERAELRSRLLEAGLVERLAADAKSPQA